MINFTTWLENMESRKTGIADSIVGFLKEKLHITDDETILNMKTTDMASDVLQDLMQRGLIKSEDPDILDRIKNGISIQELVNILAGEEATSLPIDDRILAKPAGRTSEF